MITYERLVRFHEADAAGQLFFPNFLVYAHEAMEHFFKSLEGGYPRLILERRVGLPAVALESQFRAPIQYGDTVLLQTSVTRIGKRSMTLRYVFVRASDRVVAAEVHHTVATTDLDAFKSCDMPADVRALAEKHLVTQDA